MLTYRSRHRCIPENTAAYARWLAEHIETSQQGITLSPATVLFVGIALRGYAEKLEGEAAQRHAFVVVAESGEGNEEVLASAENVSAAWAAFQSAIPTRPHARAVRLMHLSRAVGANRPFVRFLGSRTCHPGAIREVRGDALTPSSS